MASLQDNYAASLDPRVVAQVTAAIYGFIETVDGEASTVTGHANRVAFANKVTLGQVNFQPLILHVCQFASVTALSTGPTSDTTVENAVATLWNIWSGV